MRDVAAKAGVSTATVSRVLAGLGGVKGATRDRVSRAAAKFNYHPNQSARGLRLGHRKVIGVIIPDLQNPFFTGVVYGLEAELYRAGYSLQMGHSDGLAEREQEQIKLLRSEGVAGLVLMVGDNPTANYESVRTWGIPTVAIDRSPGGLEVDLVCANNREGMRQAVNHLLSLGHKGIAIINGPEGINVAHERLNGYQDALRSAGISLLEPFIIHSDFRQQGGYEAMRRLLHQAKLPTAAVVANNLMTLGALQAIHEQNIRIPEDIALVCFDDMPWATSLRPPLTSVAQPVEELGRTGAQVLLKRLSDPKRSVRQVVLSTRLIVRASCGVLTAAQPEPTAVPHPPEQGWEERQCEPAPGWKLKRRRPETGLPSSPVSAQEYCVENA
jgi:DNA-binding LacI/PurR family transcriptional regulator